MRIEGDITHFLIDLDELNTMGVAIWFEAGDSKWSFETYRGIGGGTTLSLHKVEMTDDDTDADENRHLGLLDCFEMDDDFIFAGVSIDGTPHILWGEKNEQTGGWAGGTIHLDTEPNYRNYRR